MSMTEEEAKTKRCQESFGPSPQQATVCNAPLTTGSPMFYAAPSPAASPFNCIGSACMAWRWHEWETDPDTRQRVRGLKGHCGKAGRTY